MIVLEGESDKDPKISDKAFKIDLNHPAKKK